MCVPKSNSNDRYAITCDVIVYHMVHFFSIRLINKCQSGIDIFFTSVCERAIYSTFMKIWVPSQVFRRKTKWKWCEVITLDCQLCFRKKSASLILKKGRRWEWINMQAHFRWLHAIRKGVITEKKNVAWKNMKICNYFCKYSQTCCCGHLY